MLRSLAPLRRRQPVRVGKNEMWHPTRGVRSPRGVFPGVSSRGVRCLLCLAFRRRLPDPSGTAPTLLTCRSRLMPASLD
eukprot:1141003-Lingulodinium_polyedra.AAC.1